MVVEELQKKMESCCSFDLGRCSIKVAESLRGFWLNRRLRSKLESLVLAEQVLC